MYKTASDFEVISVSALLVASSSKTYEMFKGALQELDDRIVE